MSRRKKRPGFYGSIYGDLHRSKKWMGGLHASGKTYAPLSWGARGLWTHLLSSVVFDRTNGAFLFSEAEALCPEASGYLMELQANDLMVDLGDGKWSFKDYGQHNMTREEYEEKRASNTSAVHDHRVSKQSGNALLERYPLISLSSEDQESQRAPAVPSPAKASTPLSRMMEAVHQEAIKQARAKGHGDPPETHNPFWEGWKSIARWVLGAAKLRGWDEEQAISMGRLLVVAFYESEDPRTKKGYPLSYLARNPAQYAEEAKGRAA